jgi:hypothetical protein
MASTRRADLEAYTTESVASLWEVLLGVCSLYSLSVLKLSTFHASILAAVFFSAYDTLKRILPTPPHLAPINHMLSASIAEVVRDINT